jgi:hypothetical protein
VGNTEKRSLSNYLFELATYMASSARGCLEEPQSYGTFRLIDALGRVLKIQDYLPEAEKDRFLEKVREDIERNKFLKLTNPKAFEQFIDDLILELAKEAKKRSI